MAKKSLKVKQLKKLKFKNRYYSRCLQCGRPHSVLRKFKLCRICFRKHALQSNIPGVTKSSW